jgi:hypothetical protein
VVPIGNSVETFCSGPEGMLVGGQPCTLDEECFSGFCMGLEENDSLCFHGCHQDNECTAGQICSNVVFAQGQPNEKSIPACLPAPDFCGGDQDCPEDQICLPAQDPNAPNTLTGICLPPQGAGAKTAGQFCTDDAECESEICNAFPGVAQKICWSMCADISDCAPGLKCYPNLIHFVFDQGTDTPLDDKFWATGSCTPDLGSFNNCTGDSNCPGGEFCYHAHNQTNTELEPRCLKTWTSGASKGGETCMNDVQCFSGVCLQGTPTGICLALCAGNQDCYGGTSCEPFDGFVLDNMGTDDEGDDVVDTWNICLP